MWPFLLEQNKMDNFSKSQSFYNKILIEHYFNRFKIQLVF